MPSDKRAINNNVDIGKDDLESDNTDYLSSNLTAMNK